MPNVIGTIPEFTSDETTNEPLIAPDSEERVIKADEAEKETPVEPASTSVETDQKPLIVDGVPSPETKREDTGQPDLERAVHGLQQERAKLLREISELKGQRREIKQEQLLKVEQQIDDLKDVNPDDVNLIEKVLRAKGYVRKDDVQHEFYERIKQEELNNFLEKYPEYKPENDANDINWTILNREFSLYARPNDPRMIGQLLERARRATIVQVPASDRGTEMKQRQLKVASAGSGGTQRSSSNMKTFEPEKRMMLKHGGFSEEEIQAMEKRLK